MPLIPDPPHTVLLCSLSPRYIRDVLLLDLPIIALTAEIGIDARTAVLSAGANSLISKPAQAEDIIRMLDELIYLDF